MLSGAGDDVPESLRYVVEMNRKNMETYRGWLSRMMVRWCVVAMCLLFWGAGGDAQANDPVRFSDLIEINGVKQFVSIRGAHADLPVLLTVHSDPGTPETFMFDYFTPELEHYFIVANWEQRGTGVSLLTQKPSVETMTIEQFIDDTRADRDAR
jgi:hypothetical protein